MTAARPHIVTPGMQEASLTQLHRMILGSQRLAAALRFDALETALGQSATQASTELAAHRARHGQTVPDREPVT